MGYRVHVAKKYIVDYDCCGLFNYQSDAVERLLEFMCEDLYVSENGNIMEIPRDCCERFLTELEYTPEEYFKDCGFEDSKEQVIKGFKYLIDNSDPNSEYIHLRWF